MVFTRADALGKVRWYEANGQPLPPEVNVTPSGIVLIRDITDRSFQRLQEEFLMLASHELRSPLSMLKMGLQLIEKRLPPPDQDKAGVRRSLQMSMTAVESLDVLTRDLVDAVRLRTGKLRIAMEAVDLVPLAREAVESAQLLAPPGQQVALSVGAPSLVARGDAVRLRQVLINLLTNALAHAPSTPRIDVRLRPAEGDAGVAELQVQDYGPGMPAADLPQIFSRFYQVAREEQGAKQRQNGLGLGLYISKELVTAHGGEITVSSEEEKGTTFTVHLPLLQVNGASSAQPS